MSSLHSPFVSETKRPKERSHIGATSACHAAPVPRLRRRASRCCGVSRLAEFNLVSHCDDGRVELVVERAMLPMPRASINRAAALVLFFVAVSHAQQCCPPSYSYCSYGGAWNLVVLATCTGSATQTWVFNSATSVYSQTVGSSSQECFDLCGYSLFTGACPFG